jgi:uncharacterized protein YggE
MLSIDKPEQASMKHALQRSRLRGPAPISMLRRSGRRVKRILSVSEAGGQRPYPRPMYGESRAMSADAAQSKIDPGEQAVTVSLSVSFELE